jgi:hypothetical protein
MLAWDSAVQHIVSINNFVLLIATSYNVLLVLDTRSSFEFPLRKEYSLKNSRKETIVGKLRRTRTFTCLATEQGL